MAAYKDKKGGAKKGKRRADEDDEEEPENLADMATTPAVQSLMSDSVGVGICVDLVRDYRDNGGGELVFSMGNDAAAEHARAFLVAVISQGAIVFEGADGQTTVQNILEGLDEDELAEVYTIVCKMVRREERGAQGDGESAGGEDAGQGDAARGRGRGRGRPRSQRGATRPRGRGRGRGAGRGAGRASSGRGQSTRGRGAGTFTHSDFSTTTSFC